MSNLSGIDFYCERGYLGAATDVYEDYNSFIKAGEKTRKEGFVCYDSTGDKIKRTTLPFLNLPKESKVFYQPQGKG